ncbi:hypothetical protein VSU19_15865 [Verrucomicrobiales bacterium BCK34]|nr:hypothetical protein [Verrucomicrobiales bacterium BCK34]
MKNSPLLIIGLALVFAGCTDLSKLEKDDEKDPLDPATPEEMASEKPAAAATQAVRYPFERVIKDLSGRSIEATILAKLDSEIGFEKVNGTQKFILPLDRLSEEDQAFFKGIYDGGDFQSVSKVIARAARLGDREAVWNRDFERAEREADKLGLPRLTAFFIAGDPRSKALEKELLFSRAFREWAGQNLVLCAIPVEPPQSRMAITSVVAENRRVAELYGVTDSLSLALNIPEKEDFYRVSMEGVETVEDVIEAVEKLLKKAKW